MNLNAIDLLSYLFYRWILYVCQQDSSKVIFIFSDLVFTVELFIIYYRCKSEDIKISRRAKLKRLLSIAFHFITRAMNKNKST